MDRRNGPSPEMLEAMKKEVARIFEVWRKMRERLVNEEGWQRIMLWDGEVPAWNPEVTDQDPPSVYLAPVKPGKGLFVICAGGAFRNKCDHEAWPVADFFAERDINVAILDYRVQPYNQEISGMDGLRAIRVLRSKAVELGIPADKIAIGGFSAGGMLSAMTATHFDYGNAAAADPVEQVSSRPDAAVICYGAFEFMGMPQGQLGYSAAVQREKIRINARKNLRWDCPPFFLFQTHKDDPALAMRFGLECAEMGIEFEVHTFHDGSHGQGLYDGKNGTEDIPHTHHWAELAAEWLHDYGF